MVSVLAVCARPLTNFVAGVWDHVAVKLNKVTIIAAEIFAVFSGLLPNVVKWFFARYFENITSETLKVEIDGAKKCASLHFHGKKDVLYDAKSSAILFLHGDFGHPATLFNFIQLAQKKEGVRVFSLSMPHDPTHQCYSEHLISQAIQKIGSEKLVMVGHSKGAIQSAHTAFVSQEKIAAVISIAGRLARAENDHCHPELQPLIEKIAGAITEKSLPLYQIVPENDWNAPVAAMEVRQETSIRIAGAMHFNVLYREEAHAAFETHLTAIFDQVS